jgi:hypothetical protein
VHTFPPPESSFKLVIIKNELIIGNTNGELKIFDLHSLMLKKIIYAFEGTITHLLARDKFFACVGFEEIQNTGREHV